VCCAATTSTPTASSPRATCSASPSTTSANTPSRTTAPRPRATTRSTTSASGTRASSQNFGCGSSREHAPQALTRWGFDAFVGGSFAEIFFGNCTALGLPCVTLAPSDLAELMDAVALVPEQTVEVDLEAREVRHRGKAFAAKIPDGSREQLLEGTWNATSVLLDAGDAIEAAAARLPYTSGFRT
jgi:3-isopropylmalate/(R)-2-methylmalate dehydratase small subunit